MSRWYNPTIVVSIYNNYCGLRSQLLLNEKQFYQIYVLYPVIIKYSFKYFYHCNFCHYYIELNTKSDERCVIICIYVIIDTARFI